MANKPNNPSLWSKAKSMAKQKFDVYPSAYANGWAAKWYKSKGGTWRSAQEGGMIYKPIYQTSGTVKIDNKNYSIKSPEYRKMYDEGVIASVDAEGVPTFYKDESIWDDYYEDKRKNKVADEVRRGTAMFARPILDTALEMSGVPGAIRFSKDPIKNLSGTGKVLSNFTVPALAMNTYNYMQGRPFFNISNEDLEGLGNTLDVVGLAAPLAGTLVKGGLKYAPNLLRKAPKFIKPNLINESLDLVNPKLKFANQSVDASKILEPQTIVDNTPWSMQEMPGLHIKSTMTGSPFEKQLSKTGDLNVNNIKAHINKADVSQQDKFILEKVLNEKFPGQQKINYNDFRKAVQEELVDLQKVPIEDYEHKLWGVNELGFPGFKRKSYETSLKFINKDNLYYSNVKNYNKNNLEKVIQDGEVKYKVPARFEDYDYVPEDKIDIYLDYVNKKADDFFTKEYPKAKEIEETLKKLPEVELLTFENLDKFGKGNPKHFNDNTLLHSRGMIEPDNPDIYHILEQQSDYYQNMPTSIDLEKLPIYNSKLLRKQEELIKDQQLLDYMKKNGKTPNGDEVMAWHIDQFENRVLNKENELKQLAGNLKNPIQKEFLGKSHQERLLQENVKHAAERGMSKVRLPTSETAAKIQKYKKLNSLEEIDNASKDLELIENPEAFADKYQIIRDDYYGKIADQNIIKKLEEYQKNPQEFINKRNATLQKHYHAISSSGLDINTIYKPEHETVLRKYNEMEKMIQKTIGVKPRKVTDAKGNSWFEFDIPESYKQGKAEIRAFRSGGKIKAQTGDIIYVSDPNDPRLKMYQDSTTMYNTTKPFLDEIAKQNRSGVYNQRIIAQLQSNNLGFFDTNPLYDTRGNIIGQSQSSKVPVTGIDPIDYTTVYAGPQPWRVGFYKKPVERVEYRKPVYVPPVDPKEFEITMKDLDNKREKERLQKMVPPLQEEKYVSKEPDYSDYYRRGYSPEDAETLNKIKGMSFYRGGMNMPLTEQDKLKYYKQGMSGFQPDAIWISKGDDKVFPSMEDRMKMNEDPTYFDQWMHEQRSRKFGPDYLKKYPGRFKMGGRIKAQDSFFIKPTQADSTAVYNSARNLQNQMLNLGYEQKNITPFVDGKYKDYYMNRSTGDWTKTGFGFEEYNPQNKSINYEFSLDKNNKVKVNKPNLEIDKRTFTTGTSQEKGFDRIGETGEKYYSNEKVDDNKFNVAELYSHIAYNTDLPLQLLDERIAPQGKIDFQRGTNPRAVGYDRASMLYYDPVAVKPFVDRSPEEHAEFQKKYGNYNGAEKPLDFNKAVPEITPEQYEQIQKNLDESRRQAEKKEILSRPLEEPQKIKEVDLSRGLRLGMTPEDAAIYAQMEGLGYYDRNGHVRLVPQDMVNLYKSYKANNQHFNYFKPNAIYYSGGEYYWPTEEERLQMIGNPEYVKEWVEKARYRRYGKNYDDYKKSNPEMFRGPGVGYFGHNKLGGKINRKGGNIPCYTCGGQIYRKR